MHFVPGVWVRGHCLDRESRTVQPRHVGRVLSLESPLQLLKFIKFLYESVAHRCHVEVLWKPDYLYVDFSAMLVKMSEEFPRLNDRIYRNYPCVSIKDAFYLARTENSIRHLVDLAYSNRHSKE